MAMAYNMLDELENAKNYIKKALKLNPEFPMAWCHMGTSSELPRAKV
jgi:hypothetical protein